MSKYQEYYEQILSAKEFPFSIAPPQKDIKKVVNCIGVFVRKNKLPLTVKRRMSRIIINKKADA